MKVLQKTQNKALRFLNNTKIKDKLNTKKILGNLNMLSVNQLNTQIKLIETWKAMNGINCFLNNLVNKLSEGDRITRSITNGELVEEGASIISRCTYQNDASRIWNKAPVNVKSCKSLWSVKKEIKNCVNTLPI